MTPAQSAAITITHNLRCIRLLEEAIATAEWESGNVANSPAERRVAGAMYVLLANTLRGAAPVVADAAREEAAENARDAFGLLIWPKSTGPRLATLNGRALDEAFRAMPSDQIEAALWTQQQERL